MQADADDTLHSREWVECGGLHPGTVGTWSIGQLHAHSGPSAPWKLSSEALLCISLQPDVRQHLE
jgi:hypothetical protein